MNVASAVYKKQYSQDIYSKNNIHSQEYWLDIDKRYTVYKKDFNSYVNGFGETVYFMKPIKNR